MRKFIATLFLIVMVCVLIFAQVTTTPNLQLQLPPRGTVNYDVILNNNFQLIDSAIGILQNAYQGVWSNTAVYSKGQEVNYLGTVYVSLTNSNFNNTPSTSPSTWAPLFASSGTVTSVGDLTNLFTVATRTTTPAFSLVSQSANVVFAGPTSGVSSPPTWRPLVAADIPSFLNSNTSGNATTSSALATTPTLCSAGNYSRGIDTFGNAQGCTAVSGGVTTFTAVSHQFLNSYNSATTLFTALQPGFSDLSGTATAAQLPATIVYSNQANTYTGGMKQTFGASTTTAGLSFGGVTADPSTLVNGDIWYRSDTNRPMVRSNGISQQFAFVGDTFAPASITGFGTAGNYMRSSGTAWAASTIQAADVPTLNQNTTGKATANVMNWGVGPYAGSIPATSGTIIGRTTLPAAVTVVSFTMFMVTPGVGCTTLPAYQLIDLTNSTVISTITIANSTAYYSNTGLSTAVTSGHDIGVKVSVSAGGCTTAPANAMWNFWYTM